MHACTMNAYGPLLTEYYRTHEGVKGDCVFPHVCSEGHFGTEGYVVCCDSLSQLSLGILMTACMHAWVGQFKVPRVQHSLSRIMLLMSTHKVRQREISVMTIDGQECDQRERILAVGLGETYLSTREWSHRLSSGLDLLCCQCGQT